MSVLLVDNALALKSMRSSDFDANSAYGEVIDNSIQAGAKNIHIRVVFQPKSSKQFEPIVKMAFADDGHGMNADVLHHCLQLGYSTRYNDRNGIGRFGVGMTLGAINQCKRVEVFSRTTTSDWQKVYIDLDEVEKTAGTDEAAGIAPPTPAQLSSDVSDVAPAGAGTVVVWSKYDNQQERASTLVRDMHKWIGRTFRYFIWDGINIKINGEAVFAIDPLYRQTELSRFPNDPPAEAFEPIVFSYPIPTEDVRKDGPKESTITIRMSLLPENLRSYAGAGGSAEARERFIPDNEGISILRNRREVFYGPIPYWPGRAFEEIDRWWGCEISFDAVLDKVFTVKNIKRGAIPVTELKRLIYEQITPTRNTAVERVKAVWAAAKAEKIKEGGTSAVDTGHSVAENVAMKTQTAKTQIDKNKDLELEVANLVKQLESDATQQEQSAWATKFRSQPFTIIDKSWRGSTFLDPHFLGGKAVLEYNMQHVFFQVIKDLREGIDAGEDLETNAHRIKTLIDIVFMSYARAEGMFEPEQEMTAETMISQLRANWGNFLQSYVKTWLADEGSVRG